MEILFFAQVTGYWKFQFTVTVKTEKGYEVDIVTGGDDELIYRYNPFSTSWEHYLESLKTERFKSQNTKMIKIWKILKFKCR